VTQKTVLKYDLSSQTETYLSKSDWNHISTTFKCGFNQIQKF